MLVAFGATANHCAFYLMISSTVEAREDDLEGYDTSKGAIRFRALCSQPMTAMPVKRWPLEEHLSAERSEKLNGYLGHGEVGVGRP